MLNVVSLFRKVPLWKAVNIIFDYVHNQNLIKTTLSKKVLQKLILDSCQKTTFSANYIILEQKDGVSIEASLGLIMVNIILKK